MNSFEVEIEVWEIAQEKEAQQRDQGRRPVRLPPQLAGPGKLQFVSGELGKSLEGKFHQLWPAAPIDKLAHLPKGWVRPLVKPLVKLPHHSLDMRDMRDMSSNGSNPV